MAPISLIATLYGPLKKFSFDLMGNEALSEEITQTAFTKIALLFEQGWSSENIKAVLYVTVRDLCQRAYGIAYQESQAAKERRDEISL